MKKLALLAFAFIAAPVCAADYQVVTPTFGACDPGAPDDCRMTHFMGDPKTGAFQRIFHFPSGFVFPKHWHVNNETLVMTKGKLSISADGEPEKTIGSGTWVYIPAKKVHWGVCPEECEFFLSVDGADSFNVVESK
jgi:quercetin dioxygenase-like cupin family protein